MSYQRRTGRGKKKRRQQASTGMCADPYSARKHKGEAQGSYTSHSASQERYLPGGMLVAKVAPLDQDLPAGPRQAGAAADEGAGLGPGLLHQHAWLAAIPPLEVDHLALGNAHEQRLRHPLVVDVGLADPLHQILCLLLGAWNDSKPVLKRQEAAGVELQLVGGKGSAKGLPGEGMQMCWLQTGSCSKEHITAVKDSKAVVIL